RLRTLPFFSASMVRRTSPGLSSTSRMSIALGLMSGIMVCSLCRDGEKEGRALPGLRLDPDPSAVALHDPLADGQADSGSRIVGPAVEALKDQEDAASVLRLDPDTVVANGKQPLAALLPG